MLTARMPRTATPRTRSSASIRPGATLAKRSVPSHEARVARCAKTRTGRLSCGPSGESASLQPCHIAGGDIPPRVAGKLGTVFHLAPERIGIGADAESAKLDAP